MFSCKLDNVLQIIKLLKTRRSSINHLQKLLHSSYIEVRHNECYLFINELNVCWQALQDLVNCEAGCLQQTLMTSNISILALKENVGVIFRTILICRPNLFDHILAPRVVVFDDDLSGHFGQNLTR